MLLEKRERDWRELQRRHNSKFTVDAVALREAEARNSELEDELENAPGLLEKNMNGYERLLEIVESHGGQSADESTGPEGRIEPGVSKSWKDSQAAWFEHDVREVTFISVIELMPFFPGFGRTRRKIQRLQFNISELEPNTTYQEVGFGSPRGRTGSTGC